ncbi:copper-binding protein [Novosphingobium sp. G106]|uniref:copper-binding protein n=1 Tax=Novosphingobium sp. G106 TaxID=2849500 RepID=UPI001C2D93FA|nr:copper-binding protein [Novosphingobium sp. G106]MBV1692394.1 copper-binding protein [Novosphingobium sp. G106]
MKPLYLTAALAAAVLLSGCGKKAETPAAEPSAAPAPAVASAASDMGKMDMPVGATMAKSTGTVTAIDKVAGKITLDHKAIPEVKWPAMTMAFAAKPALLESVAVGDKVAFDVTITGNAGEVTAIKKQ